MGGIFCNRKEMISLEYHGIVVQEVELPSHSSSVPGSHVLPVLHGSPPSSRVFSHRSKVRVLATLNCPKVWKSMWMCVYMLSWDTGIPSRVYSHLGIPRSAVTRIKMFLKMNEEMITMDRIPNDKICQINIKVCDFWKIDIQTVKLHLKKTCSQISIAFNAPRWY